ncbi:MAG TPA: KpsF/GutQ family sugar-phosphate isomerase [Marinobacter sp.]|nr:KpsF/GutQ family sugar-phosphate isomerase [Marinobacter sp.]
MQTFDFAASAKRTIRAETDAVNALIDRIDGDFGRACSLILACTGRVIVTGMGKSGHIGKKIAATLASTGTPAFFMHPGEACHGDLGMVTRDDVLIAISYSGSSTEILTLLPLFKRLGIPLISMTGMPASPLAETADAHLNIYVEREACPLALAPTSSTTVTTVLGDALAIALLEARGFTAEDFAFSHPGGALGRKLLLKVRDIMHTGNEVPRVAESAMLTDALLVMTEKGFGMTLVENADGALAGIYTDGDLRRSIDQGVDVHQTIMRNIINRHPATIDANTLAAEALKVMEERKITALVVEDDEHRALGVVHMHDLLRQGVV